jgi:hypothetical protein
MRLKLEIKTARIAAKKYKTYTIKGRKLWDSR